MILLKRFFTAFICSILIAFLLGIALTSMYDYGFYLVILLLIYLVVGVPCTFVIDRINNKLLRNKKGILNFLINLALYIIFGLLVGFVLGNFLPHSGFTSSLFKFYLQTGVICSVSFYIMINILVLIIMLTRLLLNNKKL